MTEIRLQNVKKNYGPIEVIHGVDITIDSGEFVVFVGPSGCGKSTLLRMIAGLEEISAGELVIDAEVVNHLPPKQRGIAMVFQSYALYPHMTVYKNMAFGLKLAKLGKKEIDRQVREAARILQLEDYLKRRPAELSGGQRQRVAIGRAITRNPKVFLFDEPLSNLDAALRVQTRIEIAKLHQDLKSTIIYVTHDQVEAMTLADKIVVLNGGNVEQIGSPLTLYHQPANAFVAGFIGSPAMNFVPVGDQSMSASFASTKGCVRVGIRPEHLLPESGGDLQLSGRVDLVERLGDVSYIYLQTPSGIKIIASVAGTSDAKSGQAITLSAIQQNVHLFDSSGACISND